MLKFPEQIFQKLDNESLFKCRDVSRSWKSTIDDRNYPWLRIANIPTVLKKRNKYIHLAAETGQIQAFKTAFNQEKNSNITNNCGETSFHLSCKNGRILVAQFLLKNTELEINVTAKDNDGINLNAKTKSGYTAFNWACTRGHSDIVKILMENAVALSIELNSENSDGLTAFNLACHFEQVKGHSDVIRIFMENAAALSINLTTFKPEPHDTAEIINKLLHKYE